MRTGERGFTLIELVITVAIVSILAMAVVPLNELSVQRGKERELRVALWTIREALDAHKRAFDAGRIEKRVDASGYPANLRLLVDGVVDIKSPEGAKIYFLRNLPRDPFDADPTQDAELTWGKRAYSSPRDYPAEGDDVFDVYSLAPGMGLNGVAYRNW
jgi:general secretion pathway protein G